MGTEGHRSGCDGLGMLIRNQCLSVFSSVFFFVYFFLPFSVYAAVLDSYLENFDSRQDGATIDSIDSWSVSQGATTGALVQSSVTPSGSGRALKLTGALTTVQLGRSKSYGSLTPTWIRYSARPGYSAQNPSVPTSGIGAACFSYNGKVLAANGSSWVDTGMSYTVGEWYDVAMKLNFKTHRYDLYLSPKATPKVQFLPIKEGLKFIDTSVNSLSKIKFYGSYSTTLSDDVYIDDVSVTYIDRLEIISTPQKLMLDQASGPITVQLQSSNAEPQTAISNITLELKSTSPKGKFSLSRDPWKDTEQVVIQKDAQQAVFYYKDTVAGKPIITVSEYPDQGFTDATQQQEIVTKVSYFDLEATSPRVAGENFLLKISAKNEDGTINESYAGEVTITANYLSPASGTYKLSPDNASGFAKGKLELNIAYPDCGLITITVADKDNPSKTGTSAQLLFLPASFSLNADNLQTVAKPFSLSISAKNTQGATCPNYNSIVNLYPVAVVPQNISGGLLSPATISGSEFKNGIANVNLAYNLYGTIKIRAEDVNDTHKQGLSNEITFLPKGLSVSVEQPAGGRDFFYIGEPIGIIVKVEDELGNPIPNYPGIVELSSSAGLALPSDYTFNDVDAGQHRFLASPVQAGDYTVIAKAEGALKAESPKITVKNASIQVLDTTSAVGTGEVVIQIVDEQGNVITSENNLVLNVNVVEELGNNSVSLPSGPITFSEGKAIIPVSDSEAETVTIVPSSMFKIEVKKGTITFGRAGKTGISTLMWRELKTSKPK